MVTLEQLYGLLEKGIVCAYCGARECGCGAGPRVFHVGDRVWAQVVKLKDYSGQYVVYFGPSGCSLLCYPVVRVPDTRIISFRGYEVVILC